MRGWIVLAAVLLLLFLLGQLRLGAVGEYGPGGAGAWFRRGLSASASTQGGAQGLRKGEGAQAREGAPCGGGTRRRTLS